MTLIPYIQKHTQLPEKGITDTVELLHQDSTITFISRYRKEPANMDGVQIEEIVRFQTSLLGLDCLPVRQAGTRPDNFK